MPAATPAFGRWLTRDEFVNTTSPCDLLTPRHPEAAGQSSAPSKQHTAPQPAPQHGSMGVICQGIPGANASFCWFHKTVSDFHAGNAPCLIIVGITFAVIEHIITSTIGIHIHPSLPSYQFWGNIDDVVV